MPTDEKQSVDVAKKDETSLATQPSQQAQLAAMWMAAFPGLSGAPTLPTAVSIEQIATTCEAIEASGVLTFLISFALICFMLQAT
jgi:hypothetical protein